MPKASAVINALELKDSTKKAYLSRLTSLNDGKEPTNYKFLEDTDAIEKKLEKYAETTKRTFYIAIVTYLPEKNTSRKYIPKKLKNIIE